MAKLQKTFIETLRDIILGFTVCFALTSIILWLWATLISGDKTYYLSKLFNIFITKPQYWLFTSLFLISLTTFLYYVNKFLKNKKYSTIQEADMAKWKINIREAHGHVWGHFSELLKESTNIWLGVTRLIITLSASFLLLSMAVTEKLFPIQGKVLEIPKLLAFGWVALFSAIIFGIIAELETSIFYVKRAKEDEKILKDFNRKLADGIEQCEHAEEDEERYMIDLPILWGTLSIDSFLLAIICLCTALLEKSFYMLNHKIIWSAGVLFIVGMNIYLLRKRKK